MTPGDVYDQASEVKALKGNVFVDGPDGVDVALTPEAAEETADRLFHASALAAGQRRLASYTQPKD